jgi:superfamily II DNA/RNA helicase
MASFCANRTTLNRILVFVATKRSADSLTNWLTSNGVYVAALHGGRSQEERDQTLRLFKTGPLPILVLTDVANHIYDQLPYADLVVNYDLPTHIGLKIQSFWRFNSRLADAYIRRTCRSNSSGFCLAMINESSLALLPALHDVLVQCKQGPPKWFSNLADKARSDAETTNGIKPLKRISLG